MLQSDLVNLDLEDPESLISNIKYTRTLNGVTNNVKLVILLHCFVTMQQCQSVLEC